jgi:hypothetical protein
MPRDVKTHFPLVCFSVHGSARPLPFPADTKMESKRYSVDIYRTSKVNGGSTLRTHLNAPSYDTKLWVRRQVGTRASTLSKPQFFIRISSSTDPCRSWAETTWHPA